MCFIGVKDYENTKNESYEILPGILIMERNILKELLVYITVNICIVYRRS